MEKKFAYQSATISYRVDGAGQPVVLLHGFGEDSHIWDQQMEFLKAHCLLIVPDIPGSGKSSLLSPENASVEDYAECVHSLLLQENISSCIMLGHSMGGYITLAFAEKYPGMLTAFGLINSTAFADNAEKKNTRLRAIETIAQYGAAAFIRTTIPNLFAARFKEMYPEKVEELIETGKHFTKEALQQYYRVMMNRPDRTHVLKSNPLPVLFVTATEDGPAPMKDVLQQAHLPDKSYIHVLQDVGHMSMWEAAAELNNFVLAFISRK